MSATDASARNATRFIVLIGLTSLFADMTYEGSRSITGPFLGTLGATGALVATVAGAGELVGYGLRWASGVIADRTRRYWAITLFGYTINLLAVPALALAGSGVDEGELAGLRAAAAERPNDMDAQFALAQAAFASGARDEAADTLLEMIRRQPDWNEGAAKAKLLQIFEAVGLEDPWVSAQRRKLSLLLFG